MDDVLKNAAHAAILEERAAGRTGILGMVRTARVTAGLGYSLAEYKAAVEWALAHPYAADLPDGSVVADRNVVYIKNRPSPWSQWRGTDGSHVADLLVDGYIAAGATVLRVGYGKTEG